MVVGDQTGYGLEQLLESAAAVLASPPPSGTEEVVRLWPRVRECVQSGKLEPVHAEALQCLTAVRHSLLVSDFHAKLLLSLISTIHSSDARSSALLLLCSWLKSRRFSASKWSEKQALGGSVSLESVVDITWQALRDTQLSIGYLSEAVLLLGLVCVTPDCSAALRNRARQIILSHLPGIFLQSRPAHILAGLGYLMTASHGADLLSVLKVVLSLWRFDLSGKADGFFGVVQSQNSDAKKAENFSRERCGMDGPPLGDCPMLICLFEFYWSSLVAQPQSVAASDARLVLRQLSKVAGDGSLSSPCCLALMVAAGFLKSKAKFWQDSGVSRENFENIIGMVAYQILQDACGADWFTVGNSADGRCLEIDARILEFMQSIDDRGTSNLNAGGDPWALFQPLNRLPLHIRHCLQCLSLAVAHCGPLSPDTCILGCLLFSLLRDLLNLSDLHSALMADMSRYATGSADVPQMGRHIEDCILEDGKRYSCSLMPSGSCTGCELKQLKGRTASVLFGLAGAVARSACHHYQYCSGNMQRFTEMILWCYSQNLYHTRQLINVFVHSISPTVESGSLPVTEDVERIFDVMFLLNIVFFTTAVGGLRAERLKTKADMSLRPGLVAARGLDALSCLELSRSSHIPLYGSLVAGCVELVLMDDKACLALVSYLPPYSNLLLCPGLYGSLAASYCWDLDETQSARISFYLRILPSCLKRLPDQVFVDAVAPLMFLYLQHPSEAISRSCHALFKAFLCQRSSSDETNGKHLSAALPALSSTEQLVAFYMKRSLETYPGLTSFDSFVSVIGAIVHHLPPGSQATLHCVNLLVDKYTRLHESASKLELERGAKQLSISVGSDPESVFVSQAARNIRQLLLHLIPIVDLLVLPELLKAVSKLVLGLPFADRHVALEEAFKVVSGLHDYTRKHVVVPWLQSLAFLCRSENPTRLSYDISLPDDELLGQNHHSYKKRFQSKGLRGLEIRSNL